MANFLVLSNESGYFTSFAVRGTALNFLNVKFPCDKRDVLDEGNLFFVKVNGRMLPFYDYNVRTYQGNLLTQLHPLYRALNGKPDNPKRRSSPANMIVHC